eukprot:8731518-Pyramimonas_sp.AAC.1
MPPWISRISLCLGLDADIKPLLSHSATGEFNSPPKYLRTPPCVWCLELDADIKPLLSHSTTGEFNSPPKYDARKESTGELTFQVTRWLMSVSSPISHNPLGLDTDIYGVRKELAG